MTRMIESAKRPKIVGNFIRQRREALNLSQRALGLLFEPPVTTQFISNVERGVTPLPPAHVPTLTKALQVSEAEMMGLLEKEYTLKLSGRLGLPQDTNGASRAGAVIIPMSQSHLATTAATQLLVSPHDFEFVHGLYEAYKTADPKTRQAFVTLCQSMLNLRLSPTAAGATAVSSTGNSSVAVGSGSGERPQG